ncbi:hypothetical protein EDC04DRAFT_2691146 [Pisolithus marmoratus]|nr:hypothetical protein EDC04DRAFT_2691146 [Pisolithus marmoratus]
MLFSPAFTRGDANAPFSKLEWSCMEAFSQKLESYNLKPLIPPPHRYTVEDGEIDYQN